MGVEVRLGLSQGRLAPHLSTENVSLSTNNRIPEELEKSGATILGT